MSIEHQLREAAARCLSVLQRYHDGERTAAAGARTAAEVEVVIGWLLELDVPSGMTERCVLKPVESHLLDHYGPEAGGRLNAEFVEAFEGAGMYLIYKQNNFHIFNFIRT